MDLIEYQVLLPNKFWDLAKSEDELNRMIKKYFSVGYPNYKIKKVIQNGESRIAICERKWLV
ncbi:MULTISPECIES: hypothetical protein [Bacillus cereus group]|uniref:Uncharacterized protein n=1 Tax=Bacillus thuringiensis DB27 TaxID=1431339 RepID=W8YEL1_BACTU|nr:MULTISPECIES: hypothetical protein [Bacillus cereus group]MBG9629547.1 phage protein [Bacillus thuringiensis]MBG9666691.1 phage protein [Bacillus thuringiensis]MBH0355949.1 phage protein [Bacillus thuringiensis]PED78957.1 hypothetical protein CON88_04955 [Bacillus toyonensis]WIG37309.1 hypothetical protein QPL83_04150 [Bacillus toyonensis]